MALTICHGPESPYTHFRKGADLDRDAYVYIGPDGFWETSEGTEPAAETSIICACSVDHAAEFMTEAYWNLAARAKNYN